MMVLPIISNDNDDRNTRLFNAKLAWFIATSLIEGWDSGEQTKISSGDVKAIAHYKELIEPNKRYPESFAAEHVHWLSMLNVTIEKSLLINAQCWRLFYVACISMANKGKGKNVKRKM